ncbi:MAG: calcium-binding protein [Rickettsiales bacterium]
MGIPSWFGPNKIFSGSGAQFILGTLGNDLIKDTSGNDTIVGDPMYATTFTSLVDSGEGGEYCYEFKGNDIIKAGSGNDLIYGDAAIGVPGLNSLENSIFDYSGAGNDCINAGSGDDTIYGDTEFTYLPPQDTGEGGEVNAASLTRSLLTEGEGGEAQGGNDTINGESGNDLVYAGGGKDIVYGGTGNDTLDGGDGCDYLNGEGGDDVLIANGGYDTLDGGISGNDLFVFTCETDGGVIKSFQKAIEKIDLSAFYGLDFNDLTISTAAGNTTVHVPEHGGFDIIVEKVTGLTAANFIFDHV